MNSTAPFSATDIKQAALLSHLSGRPARVYDDVFVWNGHLIDRATAVVAFLKVNNQVPVGDSVKERMHANYREKFKHYSDTEDLLTPPEDGTNTDVAARIWFTRVCRIIKHAETVNNDIAKQILIDLHRT